MFDFLATVTASTKRPPAISSGKRGAPAAYLVGVKCTPLMPASTDLMQRAMLDTTYKLLETFTFGDVDIVEGDRLVIAGVEYPIITVDIYPATGAGNPRSMRLGLQELRV